MKKIRSLLHWFNVIGRLAALESFAVVSSKAFAQIQSCIACGAVVVIGHPKVLKTPLPDDAEKVEIRCPWCAQAYERSPLAERRRVAQRRLERSAERSGLRAVPDEEAAV